MPNWNTSDYVVIGDANEVQSLYELMKGLQEKKEPSVKNGFGKAWLGCLVDALGGDWKNIFCRGEWCSLEMDGDILRFTTMTAWSPCNETFDFVCEKFPSLSYFYRSEEPGMAIYQTNDADSVYFSDKYVVDVYTDEEESFNEYFEDLDTLFEWLEEITGYSVKSMQDVYAIRDVWRKENPNAYCNINEFEIVD